LKRGEGDRKQAVKKIRDVANIERGDFVMT